MDDATHGVRSPDGGPRTAILSALDQATEYPRFGAPDWFDRRRMERPQARTERAAAGGVLLRRDLMTRDRILRLDSFVPDEAPIFPGGPRTIGRPTERVLRRFSGARVRPADFTQIYNDESRALYRDSTYPWACIGRIDKPNGSWGTAALVGANTILTASHVVAGFWDVGGPITAKLTFVPAYFDKYSVLGDDWIANVVGIAAWEEIDEVQSYDLAICQIDRPMGEWLGMFGAQTYDDDWQDGHYFAHAGYPYDLSQGGVRPCYELGIAVRDDDSDSYDTLELETYADIASGQSGGPLWGRIDGDRRIIGVLSGREDEPLEEKNSLFAGGNGLVTLVRWGRDNWG